MMARPSEILVQRSQPDALEGVVIEGHPFEASDQVPALCKKCLREEHLHEEDDEIWGFDDEDFYNALDLLETSYNILKGVLLTASIHTGRRQAVQNHCDDLKQFIDEFPIFVAPAEKGSR